MIADSQLKIGVNRQIAASLRSSRLSDQRLSASICGSISFVLFVPLCEPMSVRAG
jgi:hypothetical protein